MSHPLYKLLEKLDQKRLYYSLSRHRSDTILVSVTFVGMRVEIDVFDDGRMDVSCFRGDESVEGFEELAYTLIAEYGD
ncbi:TPA: hypothetical protein QDC59_002902 [Burkholderia cenocepacia]|nr:hypothetical protein [Burkholderia cenocepacia]